MSCCMVNLLTLLANLKLVLKGTQRHTLTLSLNKLQRLYQASLQLVILVEPTLVEHLKVSCCMVNLLILLATLELVFESLSRGKQLAVFLPGKSTEWDPRLSLFERSILSLH